MTLYRDFTSRAALDAQYDVSGQVPDPRAQNAERRARSAAARAALPHEAAIAYGDHPTETLDAFAAPAADAPVVVFIHGGYWSMPWLVKELYSWVALGPHAHGCATVVLDYGSCPDRTIPELTDQCRRALAWVHRHARRFGGSPDQLYVVGHSAGGHLAARLAQTDWPRDFGLPADTIKGACPISGLYDLGPFPHTWLQPSLRLTPEVVRAESPVHAMTGPIAPMLIAWGEAETPEFARQAVAWRDCCVAHGTPAELLPLPGALHNAAITGLGDADSLLMRSIARHLARCLSG